MSQGLPSSPQPDPHQLSSESLEQQLRALPLPAVPDTLPQKLIAAIPRAAAASAPATKITSLRLWIGGVVLIGIVLSTVVAIWLKNGNSSPPPESNANSSSKSVNASTGLRAPTSKAIEQYEQAVQFDPYNADAWFNLAKAQAEAHRTAEALSSAQKALDIARSRNRSALAEAIEAWMHSHQNLPSSQSTK
jgi:tetratricopeptide (TPR) repeat protein